jgi:pimeloyl-ACP methyl ester carboxylesterase
MRVAESTLFLLHGLARSRRSWDGVVAALGDGIECIALDLPGFGANAGSPLRTVEENAAWVADRIREHEPDRWLIGGHSMGGKLATIVTAWAERGEHGLTPPAGLVLVAPSPPGPEPMSDERRDRMRGWWSAPGISAADAETTVASGLPNPIPAPGRADAVEDVQRADRLTCLAWLDRGSREDWSDAVGVLRTPAIVITGSEDVDLGAANQERLTLPHVPGAPIHDIDGAGHGLLLQFPDEVARHIAGLESTVRDRPALPAAFARLIASDRVSARTRRVMLARLAEPGDAPRALSPAQHALLGAVLARVLPQRGTDLDLAGRIDAALATGQGDGWRFAELPPDAEAWRRGLDTIAALEPGFGSLDADRQEAVLDRITGGTFGSDQDGHLTGPRMALWFQDLRADAVRTWLAHPAAQAWLRYDGFADGGDGPRKQGFTTTHAGEWETWQRDWRTGKELQA